MAEEIFQIKDNLLSIAEKVVQLPEAPRPRLAMVSYRDREDEYITRLFDFESDANEFSKTIKDVEADGGGDYPESLNEGVHVAVNKTSWNEGDPNAVRLIFLIADAPPQLNYEQDYDYSYTLVETQEKGIKVFAVASSGLRKTGEFIFRQAVHLPALSGRRAGQTPDAPRHRRKLQPGIPGRPHSPAYSQGASQNGQDHVTVTKANQIPATSIPATSIPERKETQMKQVIKGLAVLLIATPAVGAASILIFGVWTAFMIMLVMTSSIRWKDHPEQGKPGGPNLVWKYLNEFQENSRLASRNLQQIQGNSIRPWIGPAPSPEVTQRFGEPFNFLIQQPAPAYRISTVDGPRPSPDPRSHPNRFSYLERQPRCLKCTMPLPRDGAECTVCGERFESTVQ